MKPKVKETLLDVVGILVGSIIYAASVNVFTAPNNIAPGGITGISTMLHSVFGWPIGLMIFVLNLPLFFAGWRVLGWKFLGKTIVSTALVSVIIDVTAPWTPAYTAEFIGKEANPLLVALFGGVLSGTGLALIFLRGGTTGGTDIGARLLHHRWPHMSMGRLIMAIDFLVIATAGFVYGNVESSMYALLVVATTSVVVDKLLYGAQMGKIVYIVSDSSAEMAEAINTRVQRGVTLLDAHGAYSGKEKNVIFCVVRRSEVSRLRHLVREIDPRAFMVVCEAGEVVGEGFRPVDQEPV